MRSIRALILLAVMPALIACAAPAASPATAPTGAPTGAPTAPPTSQAAAGPTAAPTQLPTEAPTASPVAAVCGPIESLPLKNSGRLTLSTDNPAYPPWWGGDPEEQYPNEPAEGSGWELSDPYSMMGFEGATAYAIAGAMGFTPGQVDWLQNIEFANAFAPGEKPFDFHMAQISITEERAQAVDFSEPYFESNQALIAMSAHPATGENPSPITTATTIEELKGFTLGAARNTTSFDLIEDVIVPTVEPRVPPNNNAALRALRNGQIDGLVVDLASAFFMRDAQLEDYATPEAESTIVGQFSTDLQADQVGAVLDLDSPLTECVNAAIAQIRADGTLDAIYDEWIVTGQEIPFFE